VTAGQTQHLPAAAAGVHIFTVYVSRQELKQRNRASGDTATAQYIITIMMIKTCRACHTRSYRGAVNQAG